jgi:hypothetical protein
MQEIPVGRKNPIREASFVGWPETFRWDHDGCASARSPWASLQRFADVSVSLMPKENSLFGRINFLFRQNFSLFDRGAGGRAAAICFGARLVSAGKSFGGVASDLFLAVPMGAAHLGRKNAVRLSL